MNINEFLALKDGDRIEGMTGTKGTVREITHDRRGIQDGVMLEWDGPAGATPQLWHFTKHMTAWMHWTKLPSPNDNKTVHDFTPADLGTLRDTFTKP